MKFPNRFWPLKAKTCLERRSQVGNRRLYLDVSIICQRDAGTGIQRVVRSIFNQLVEDSPEGWEICPVIATKSHGYHSTTWRGWGAEIAGRPLSIAPGDVFLGLDLALDAVPRYRRQLRHFQAGGGQLWFVLYDLLPLCDPQWFDRRLVRRFRKWVDTIMELSDGIFCISGPVRTQWTSLLQQQSQDCRMRVEVLPLGSRISDVSGDLDPGKAPSRTRAMPINVPLMLMVGTIEPRKGHQDVLNAFDRLWRDGHQIALVIVGRAGWKTRQLQERIRTHPQFGELLIWIDDASDPELIQIYEESDAMIAASHAEGFGLPVAEALAAGLPVLARDIEVFRCHDSLGVEYFPTSADAEHLARKIMQFANSSPACDRKADKLLSWRDCTTVLLRQLAGEEAICA